MKKFYYFFILILASYSCDDTSNSLNNNDLNSQVPTLKFKIINQLPHDNQAFTEGFLVHDSLIYESTGSPSNLPKTRSVIGIVDIKTGKLDEKKELDKQKYFGEGITILKDKIYQLTYKKQTCFVYDTRTFAKLNEFKYSNKEGWGLTTNGSQLIMSDGTNTLTFINPDNFKVIRKLQVSENSFAVDGLNELEYINGYIYANVWPTNKIVKIDISSGKVIGKLDLTTLKEKAKSIDSKSLETNGIAYDSINNKVYVTGKMWPRIYQIDFNF